MARTQSDGVGGTRQVRLVLQLGSLFELLLEAVHLFSSFVLEGIELCSQLLLLLFGDVTELAEQGGNLAFLTQVLDAQCL